MSVIDSYRGRKAEQYEAKRSGARKWSLENEAVAALLPDVSTALDVPVGTGRFLPLYRKRGMTITGLDSSIDMLSEARTKGIVATLVRGSILQMPFGYKEFDVSVCMRLTNWLTPDELKQAVSELARVSDIVIVGIRLGFQRAKGRLWVHSEADFLSALREAGIGIEKVYLIGGKGYAVYRCA